jgi:hypothetical protein
MIATTITAIARMIVSSCAIFASWRQVAEPEVREANRERCVSYFTLRRLSKKCNVAKKPHGTKWRRLRLETCSSAPKICSSLPWTEKAPTTRGYVRGRGKLSRVDRR